MKLIPLRARGGSIVAFALVDDEDHEHISQHRWHLHKQGYASRRVRGADGRQRTLWMHREVLGLVPGDGLQADHKEARYKLDNRRSNLRVATNAQNAQNRPNGHGASRHRGVVWNKAAGKWYAVVKVDGKARHLGSFDDEDLAARVAREARRELMPFAVEPVPATV